MTESMIGCERKGKWFGGCRFEPRYDELPFEPQSAMRVWGYTAPDVLHELRTVKYVKDVCVTCGAERVR